MTDEKTLDLVLREARSHGKFHDRPVDMALLRAYTGDKPAATLSTTATISPPHIPPGPMAFAPQVPPPTNTGTVIKGSATVRIGGKPAARVGDTVQTCSFPAPAPNGRIMPPVPHHRVNIG